MTFPIEQIDTRSIDEAKLNSLHELYLEWDGEWTPDDPPTPLPKRLAEWRHVKELEDIPRWVVWNGDRAIATAGVYLHRTQDLENAWTWIYVSSEYRRRGLSRSLAQKPVEYAIGNGRKRIGTGIPEGSDYSFLPERAGMKKVYNERISQMKVADLDFEMLEGWIARASERAGDYELLFLPMPIPDEHRPRMIEVMDVMNTAPLEDLEEEPMRWDDEMLRDVEQAEARKQNLIYTCVARHKPTNMFVGYTSLIFQEMHPAKARQWDTGVHPEHRNRGLGRWLKATMALKFLHEHPDVEVIETENADSNDPMLNINVAMGYKPSMQHIIYQGPIEGVAAYLKG
ncbi:MAG: GNAT family N-acetyltransferase [Acidimicrobiia bacterium]